MESNQSIQDRIEAVETADGSGSELITLAIPPDRSLQSINNRIEDEYTEAQHIKTDATRKRVRKALRRVGRVLRTYRAVPDNGLIIYAGIVDGQMQTYTFDDLPERVKSFQYWCDDSFLAEPVKECVQTAPS